MGYSSIYMRRNEIEHRRVSHVPSGGSPGIAGVARLVKRLVTHLDSTQLSAARGFWLFTGQKDAKRQKQRYTARDSNPWQEHSTPLRCPY